MASPAAIIRSVFLQLGSDRSFQKGRQIEILIQVDGRPFSRESATVENGKAAGAVLGVLKTRPDLRGELDLWARVGDRQIVVTVLVDGRKVQELSWKALVEKSEEIRNTSFQVFDPPTVLSVFSLPISRGSGSLAILNRKATSCEDACAEDRQACYEETCPGQRLCQECEDQYDACVTSCNPPPPCTDPKSVSYGSAGPAVVSTSWYGTDCLHPFYGGAPEIFNLYAQTLRTYYTQTTQYCDGHSTTTVTGYSDFYWSCQGSAGFSCSFPDGYASYFCY